MKRLTVCVVAIILIVAAASLPFALNAGFGQAPQGVQLSQVEQSLHYRDRQFHGQVPIPGYTGNKGMPATWWKFLVAKCENVQPARPLPMVTTDLAGPSSQQDTLTWLDHSSRYLQLAGQWILIGSMFSNYAASFSFLSKAFAGGYPWTAQTMPEIDLLITSHDHYDHLDPTTLKALVSKIRRVITPFGVGSHLRYWGMRSEIIEERDWNQSVRMTDSLIVHVLPARHFSGRGIKRSRTLWTSFMFETLEQNIHYGGDSGCGPHFKAIGERFGSADLAIMENGQYDQNWRFIHMMPEETA